MFQKFREISRSYVAYEGHRRGRSKDQNCGGLTKAAVIGLGAPIRTETDPFERAGGRAEGECGEQPQAGKDGLAAEACGTMEIS